jgi:MFS family permease
METLLASIGAVVLTWGFIVAVFILAIVSDYNESQKDEFGWAATWTILGAICLYLLIDPSPWVAGIIAVCWVPVGLIWATIKWKLRISKTKYEIETKKLEKGYPAYEILRSKLDIDEVKSTVAYWTLFFPVSFVSTCFVNVFDSIKYLVTVKMGKFFRNMAEEAFK